MKNQLNPLFFTIGCTLLAGGCSQAPITTIVPQVTIAPPSSSSPSMPGMPSVDSSTQAQVSYIDNGVAIAGANVLVYDAQQKLVGRAVTDANGGASVAVPSSAIVTVANPATGALFTVEGVEQGDKLRFGHPGELAKTIDSAIQLSMPTALTGAARYRLMTGASDQIISTLPTSLMLQPHMIGASAEGHFDLVLVAEDDGGNPLAYSALQSATAAPALALGAWQTDFAPMMADITNTPTGVTTGFTMQTASRDHRMGGAMRPTSDADVAEALAVTIVGQGYAAIRQDAERAIDRVVVGPDANDAVAVTRYARY